MPFIQLLILFVLSLSLLILIKNRLLKLIFSIPLSIGILIQVSSFYLTGRIADYKFYEHLQWGVITNIYKEFLFEIFLIIVLMAGLTYLLVFLSENFKKIRLIIPVLVIVSSIGVLSLEGFVFDKLYETYRLKSDNQVSLRLAMRSLSIDDQFVDKSDLTSESGKNIIFISLESFEQGFIEDRPDLTPFLNKLKSSYHYYDLEPSLGGGWTSGSAFMTLSGLPAYFGKEGNEIFHGSKEFGLTTLGSVLNKAGYSMTYLLGNKQFSGMSDILETIGFEVKSEVDFDNKYERINWGIHDMDLFQELKLEIANKTALNKPFAIFANTISTHFPDGLYDERMKGVIPPKSSDLEFMVAATDKYIEELFQFLDNEQILDNTIVMIAPDHKFMGNHSITEQFGNRGLFLLSTSKINIENKQPLKQISMPSLIIDAARISTNARFLSDIVPEIDNTYIEENKIRLKDLNVAALQKADLGGGLIIQKINDSIVNIIKPGQFELLINTIEFNSKNTEAIQFQIDKRFILRKRKLLELSDFKNAVSIPNTLTILNSNEKISAFLTDSDGIISFKKDENKIQFDSLEVQSKFQSLIAEKHLAIKKGSSKTVEITIKSAGFNSKKLSWIKIGEAMTTFDRGINMILFDEKGTMSQVNFDTYMEPQIIPELITQLQKAIDSKSLIFLIAHDTAGESFATYEAQLRGLNLEKLINLKSREAYIAQINGQEVKEFTDAMTLEKSFSIPQTTKVKKSSAKETAVFSRDINRFIAHAGGKIGDKTYTNSLQALDKSYALGFRLFELDIIKTSDDVYVASHDWETWSKQTGYNGQLPVTKKVFLSYKIHDRYDPMDMDRINNWFKSHPDAVLVTDKVTEVERFANQFTDKSRLLMEVFSLHQADLALENGVTPMISENVINNNRSIILDYIKENDIKYVVLSRNSIINNRNLLQQLSDLNVKSFVYHVNFEKGKDEKYVVENEFGLVFGMYADEWSFKNKN